MTDSEQKQIWNASLRMLAASPQSRNELARRLADKEYSTTLIRWVLEALEAKGILSDQALASNLVNQFLHAKPSGRRKIGFELKRKGIAPKVCEEALAAINPEGELERARELFLNRWDKFKNLEPEKRKKRTFDFMMRRGFDYQVVRDLMAECGKEDADY